MTLRIKEKRLIKIYISILILLYPFIFLILMSGFTRIYAASNDLYDPNNSSSNVVLISSVNVSAEKISLSNLNSSSLSDSYLLSFIINNNHKHGFKLVISSTNDGKMIRTGSDKTNLRISDYVDYSISTVHVIDDEINSDGSDQTYWGLTSPYNHSSLILKDMTLDQDITLVFSDELHDVRQATRNFVYRVLVTTSINPYIFSGNFLDTIDVKIHSIN